MRDKMLVAYHNDPILKQEVMAQIRAHREADEILKGSYFFTNGKTRVCAVGCVLHDLDGGHIRYEQEFGIPAQLAHLEDGLFESMPLDLAKEWPARFMGAIEPGVDLSKVWPQMAMWLMADGEWGVINATDVEDVKAICLRVADGYRRIAVGESLTPAEKGAITRDARDAWDAWAARDGLAARDARAGLAARDAWAVRAARDAWAVRDAWAAWAARDAWAAWAARDARGDFIIASADKLIELLEAAEAGTNA